jgi:hypothetical protein
MGTDFFFILVNGKEKNRKLIKLDDFLVLLAKSEFQTRIQTFFFLILFI